MLERNILIWQKNKEKFMEKYNVILYDLSRKIEIKAVVYAYEDDLSDDIILNIKSGNIDLMVRSEGYFSAYQELRDKLLKRGYGLKCNGSLINANQSAMMEYTPKVYLVEMSRQALTKDIVSVWDYCDINVFPDTIEQNQYIEKWFESLKAES